MPMAQRATGFGHGRVQPRHWHQWAGQYYVPALDRVGDEVLARFLDEWAPRALERSMAHYRSLGFLVSRPEDIATLPQRVVGQHVRQRALGIGYWVWGECLATLALGPFASVISGLCEALLVWIYAVEVGAAYGLDARLCRQDLRSWASRALLRCWWPFLGPQSGWKRPVRGDWLWRNARGLLLPDPDAKNLALATIRREWGKRWLPRHDAIDPDGPTIHRKISTFHYRTLELFSATAQNNITFPPAVGGLGSEVKGGIPMEGAPGTRREWTEEPVNIEADHYQDWFDVMRCFFAADDVHAIAH